jgi:hypothetical protein
MIKTTAACRPDWPIFSHCRYDVLYQLYAAVATVVYDVFALN